MGRKVVLNLRIVGNQVRYSFNLFRNHSIDFQELMNQIIIIVNTYIDEIIETMLVSTVFTTKIIAYLFLFSGLIILILNHYISNFNQLLSHIHGYIIFDIINWILTNLINLIVGILVFISSMFYCFKPISDAIYTLNFHTIVDLYFSDVNILDISNVKIVGLIGLFLVISYLFVLIRDKGVLVSEINSFEPNSYVSIFTIYFSFYMIVFLIMSMYLIKQLKFIELSSYIFVIIFYLLSIWVLLLTVKSIYNYRVLLLLNTNKIGILSRNKKTERNFIEKLRIDVTTLIIPLLFIWIIVAYLLYFNIITVLFIVIGLILTYYYINMIKHINNYSVDIFLNDSSQTRYDNAFITQDFSSKDYIEIITQTTSTNHQIKIMKSAIAEIYYYVFM